MRLGQLLFIIVLPAFAQVDFTGEWAPRYHEDQPERIPGPALGDYLGIPVNDALRLRADSWDADIQTLPERQCIPHPSTYSFRGPATLRVSKVVDPVTQDVVNYDIYGTFGRASRVIYMDGRARPSANAAHTFAGFSLGKWEGGILSVETTHLKAGYLRRNGIIHSDMATMTEHFIRHGEHLTIVTIVRDPVYLTDAFIRSTDFVMDLGQHVPANPCDVTIEVVRPKGSVPHHLPETNAYVTEFARDAKLPFEATRGGSDTALPEFRSKLANPASLRATPANFAAMPASRAANAEIEVIPVRANIYMVNVAGRNIALSVGPEGVMVIDTAQAAYAERIAAEIRKLTSKPIRYVLNTSADGSANNAYFAKMGRAIGAGGPGSALFASIAAAEPQAEIAAHVQVLHRLTATPAAWPTITYFNDLKEFYFNDEAVQMHHQPAAHSDGDSIVFFRRSDVIVAGELFLTTGYPVIDIAKGGSIQGLVDALNRILDLTVPAGYQEGGTMVIPASGRLCDEADVVEYRDMLTIIRDRVQDLVSKGMTLEQVKAARPTRDYDGRYGATAGAWTTDMFVEAVYRGVSGKR